MAPTHGLTAPAECLARFLLGVYFLLPGHCPGLEGSEPSLPERGRVADLAVAAGVTFVPVSQVGKAGPGSLIEHPSAL